MPYTSGRLFLPHGIKILAQPKAGIDSQEEMRAMCFLLHFMVLVMSEVPRGDNQWGAGRAGKSRKMSGELPTGCPQRAGLDDEDTK